MQGIDVVRDGVAGNETGSTGLTFLSEGGETGAMIRGHDWSTSPLGPPDNWPQSLRSIVGLMLGSEFPMFVAWGDQLGFLYNDAYSPILGTRHPAALGRPFRQVWPEIWDDILPLIDAALDGRASYRENLPLLMRRNGFDEQTWFTFSYSPVRDESGNVAGMFCACTETTAQVLSDRKLQGERDRQRRLFEKAPGFTAILSGPDHVFEFVNEAYAELFSERDYVGRPVREVFHDLEGQGIFELLAGVYDSGERFVANAIPLVLQPLPDQPARHFRLDFIYEPIKDEYGRVTGIFAQGHDVTERILAEEALRDAGVQREAAFAALAKLNLELERQVIERTQARGRTWQVSPDLMCALDDQGGFATSNPAWQAVLGWTEAQLATMTLWDFLHPDDVDTTRAAFVQALGGRPAIKFPNRYRCTDGSYRWISWIGVAEEGLVYCTGRDITDEVEKDSALSARTAERDRLWTLSQDMFARANLDGMMTAVSPGWTQVLGWTEAELLSRPYASFMHPDDIQPTVDALAGMGQTGQSTRFQNRIATRDGGWKSIDWTVAPEEDGSNFIAVGRDLTKAHAREAELAAAQDALRQAQKMEAVGQLTGGLAHDFNNIIAGISGSLEMMSTRLAQGRIADLDRYIAGASGAAKRAAGLTQRLLAFSRRQTLDPKPTNLNALIDGLLDLVHRSMGPEITVETDSAPELWTTMVDAGQLENALLNLCINARDAMPDGGKLTIASTNRQMDEHSARLHALQPGDFVILSVSDTGTGMAPEVIERAFDPFYTTKPIGQGTGLGLSMVYGFAGQSGGAVRIHSELDKGTTVSLYLPRHLGAAVEDEVSAEPGTLPSAAGAGTVLLVDDEPLVRMLAAEALEELGYSVVEAGDGAAALSILASDRMIDLLVTDVGLPGGINGRQVADAARVSRPHLKVLFITGYAENAVLNHGHLERGMQILTKPFQMDAFATRVKDLIAED